MVENDRCARCGRSFRGEWDRCEGPEGTICHICANRAPENPPQPETQEEPPPPPPAEEEDILSPDALIPIESETVSDSHLPGFAQKNPELFKRIILTAGILVIAGAVFAALFSSSETPTPSKETGSTLHVYHHPISTQRNVNSPGETTHPKPSLFWRWLINLLKQGIALYLLLLYRMKMTPRKAPLRLTAIILPAVISAIIALIPWIGILLCVGYIVYWFRLSWQESVIYVAAYCLVSFLIGLF